MLQCKGEECVNGSNTTPQETENNGKVNETSACRSHVKQFTTKTVRRKQPSVLDYVFGINRNTICRYCDQMCQKLGTNPCVDTNDTKSTCSLYEIIIKL